MKKKYFILGLIGVISLFGSGRLYLYLTDGFEITNISAKVLPFPSLPEEPSFIASDIQFIQEALQQPYHYLGKGVQSYAFVSADQKYVIKFFKYQFFHPRPWMRFFCGLPYVHTYFDQKQLQKRIKLHKLMRSWQIVFKDLKEEAGLLLIHLHSSSSLKTQLTLYDRLGRRYEISLDEMEFCIQKKAALLGDVLLKHRQNHSLQQAQLLIVQIIDMFDKEAAKGILDKDPIFMRNTGVANHKVVHIDIGEFVQDELIKELRFSSPYLTCKIKELALWLRAYYPELLPFLEEQVHLYNSRNKV